MHDIKFIKENPKLFDESLKKRNLSPQSSKIIKLHDEYLENLKKTQSLQESRNKLSKQFSIEDKVSIDKLKNEVSDLKKKISKLNDLTDQQIVKINKILYELPNVLDEKTPIGISDDDNKIKKNMVR